MTDREAIARVIEPNAQWDRVPCKRFKATTTKHNWDQFYIWDTEHSSICNPDGPKTYTYPWRRMDTPEASEEAATALNAKEDAWWRNAQSAALDKADRILALLSSAPPAPASVAEADILAERSRQITAEGYTPEHDDEHGDGALAAAAACYAVGSRTLVYGEDWKMRAIWPRGWEFNPDDRRRELVKAGALIIAEIERLDRSKGEA